MNSTGFGLSQPPTERHIPVLFSSEDPCPPHNPQKPERNWLPWTIAVIAIGGVLGLVFWFGRVPSTANNANIDPYAKYLAFSHLHVGQANDFAGNPLIYVEGTLQNRGHRTVTAVDVQVFFSNDAGDPPRMELSSVAVIRSRQPYVETVPLSTDPLLPGKSKEFRLTFADISPTRNQKTPELHVLHIDTRP